MVKLLKFPENSIEDRFAEILNELSGHIEDEAYYLEVLIVTLENHFQDLEGDDAYMINRDIKKLRMVVAEFYELEE